MRIVPIAELERWLAENAERTLRRALAGLVEAGEVRAVEGGYELAERGANGELAPLAPPEPASGATASPIGGPAGTPGTPGANGDGTPGTPPTNAILGADFTEEGSA